MKREMNREMNRLLAALIAFLIFTIPASAMHRQQPYEDIVRWAGCHAGLVTDDDRVVVESYYSPSASILFIGTKDFPGLEQELAEMVLFHEVGHCLQHQAGLLDGTLPTLVTELDADRWAADLACGLGRDGKRLLHDIFVWAHETFGYDGDPWHGTLKQRIAQGDNAPFCKIVPLQAPVVAR